MRKYIMEFCVHKKTIDGSAETIINKSILSRLSSKYFRSAIVCRAKLWMKVYYPLRNLCQDRMPFLTDHVLFLLALVDIRQAYFPLRRCHSVTFL